MQLEFKAVDELRQVVAVAQSLRQRGSTEAAQKALALVNAILASANAKCRRTLPDADIECISDGAGNLIYRCDHQSPHEWDLNGNAV